ncbi:MAG: hypothetical protein PHC91_07890 [Eubacteriales bacterium]|nr:hypothetical protein [Eubacteriales bacterium]
MKQEHVTEERMKALKDGILSIEDTISALEHIGECDQCADAFGGCYCERELLELVPEFRSAVFSAISRERKNRIKAKPMAADGKHELFRYSFRVSIAACITLLLLFTGTMNYGINFSRSVRTELPEVNVITESLRGFSDKLIDFEVTKYLKEEL